MQHYMNEYTLGELILMSTAETRDVGGSILAFMTVLEEGLNKFSLAV